MHNLPGFLLNQIREGKCVSFMNKGMQNRKQRKAMVAIVGLVLVSFVVSIVAMGIWQDSSVTGRIQ